MNIPDKVKVGSIVYSVKLTDNHLVLDNKACSGIIHYEEAQIELNIKRDLQKVEQTWWHEVIHAIARERGLEWGDNDELYTDELAKALHALCVDNNFVFPGQEVINE